MSEPNFPCPRCRGLTRVYFGKKEGANYRRYRKCTACGYAYQTLETFNREDGRTEDGRRRVG